MTTNTQVLQGLVRYCGLSAADAIKLEEKMGGTKALSAEQLQKINEILGKR